MTRKNILVFLFSNIRCHARWWWRGRAICVDRPPSRSRTFFHDAPTITVLPTHSPLKLLRDLERLGTPFSINWMSRSIKEVGREGALAESHVGRCPGRAFFSEYRMTWNTTGLHEQLNTWHIYDCLPCASYSIGRNETSNDKGSIWQ